VLADGDGVGRLVALDERSDGGEDQAMVGAIEIVTADYVGNLIPGALVEHEAAEHRLLGFDRVRRQPEAFGSSASELGCCGFGHPALSGASERLCLGVLGLRSLDHDLHLDVHVRMQVQLDLMVADGAQRPLVQPNLAALDLDAALTDLFGNIDGSDRTE
jgi:hypothetical protein